MRSHGGVQRSFLKFVCSFCFTWESYFKNGIKMASEHVSCSDDLRISRYTKENFHFQIYQLSLTTSNTMLLNKESQAVNNRTANKTQICLKSNNSLSAFSAVMLSYRRDVQREDNWTQKVHCKILVSQRRMTPSMHCLTNL